MFSKWLLTKPIRSGFIFSAFLVLLSSCSEESDATPSNAEAVLYEGSGSEPIEVSLVSGLQQEHGIFSSLKEHDDYLLNMEEADAKVILNKEMYMSLKHYFDPYEMSVMDNDYSITIGQLEYKVENNGIYVSEKDSEDWSLETYFGASGLEDQNEVQMIHEHISDLETLQ